MTSNSWNWIWDYYGLYDRWCRWCADVFCISFIGNWKLLFDLFRKGQRVSLRERSMIRWYVSATGL